MKNTTIMWMWAFLYVATVAAFVGVLERYKKFDNKLEKLLWISIDRQLACQQAYESTQARAFAYGVKHQRMVGTVVTVKNKCGDCEIRIDREEDFDQLLDLCDDPRNWPEFQVCWGSVGQACSPEGAKTCDDLLICVAGSWDINCERANQIRDQKYPVPGDCQEPCCEKIFKLP
ncbi:MAG: hypothetical protein PHC53_00410 [Patescibacteria group bacterium]|nr:hypothetical protein [Patescibacteria group bacterium]